VGEGEGPGLPASPGNSAGEGGGEEGKKMPEGGKKGRHAFPFNPLILYHLHKGGREIWEEAKESTFPWVLSSSGRGRRRVKKGLQGKERRHSASLSFRYYKGKNGEEGEGKRGGGGELILGRGGFDGQHLLYPTSREKKEGGRDGARGGKGGKGLWNCFFISSNLRKRGGVFSRMGKRKGET